MTLLFQHFYIRKVTILTVLLGYFSGQLIYAIPQIDFVTGGTLSDRSGPLLITMGNFEMHAFNNIDVGFGTATTIDGFNSLASAEPGDITYEFGDLELIDFIGTSTTATTVYGEADGSPLFFNMFDRGNLIATASDMTIWLIINRDQNSPQFGQSSGFAQITLDGVQGSPFYDEVFALTDGTGLLNFTFENVIFDGNIFSDPANFIADSLTLTPFLLPFPTLEPTPVPEPATLSFLALGLCIVGLNYRRKKTS